MLEWVPLLGEPFDVRPRSRSFPSGQMENKELKEKESMDKLELARECGAQLVRVQVYPYRIESYQITDAQLAEFESRIRADEREKAAKVCEAETERMWAMSAKSPNVPTSFPDQAFGAQQCASAIRSQK
jgi:hypothetical protein